MQFAILDSKLCLAYFKDLFLLISLHRHTGVPFQFVPQYRYTC